MKLNNQRKRYLWLACVVVTSIIILFLPIKLDYNIHTQGLVTPAKEWTLATNSEGNLLSTSRNNVEGTVSSYNVTEFQRGDVVEFKLNEKVIKNKAVKKGDTIGIISSNEAQRKLIQLQGDFEILKAELTFYTTGQKPEDVDKAKIRLDLATQEVETQHKLMERSESLYNDSVISDENYELELNELRVKQIRQSIAEAQYMSVITGDKPERAALITTKIRALSQQIEQIEARINYFTLTAPFDGIVLTHRGRQDENIIINIADTSAFAVLAPLEVSERRFINQDHNVILKGSFGSSKLVGKIANIDNVIQMVDYKQAIFATAVFNNNQSLTPGAIAQVEIQSERITPLAYLSRILDLTLSQ